MNWTNAEDNADVTPEYVPVEDLPECTGVFDDAVTAINYLKNGNFYSEGKSYKMGIDTSYMDMVGYAIDWYDRLISKAVDMPPRTIRRWSTNANWTLP